MSNGRAEKGVGFCLEPCFMCDQPVFSDWLRIYPPGGGLADAKVFCSDCSPLALQTLQDMTGGNRAERRAAAKGKRKGE